MFEQMTADDLADVKAKLLAIAERLSELDSGSGDADAFRMCAAYMGQMWEENARVWASYNALHEAQCQLEERVRNLTACVEKAHEAAEVSECRIAEVYDRIVKARDLIRIHLEPGKSDLRAAFNFLQDAKYGLGRHGVAK